MNNLFLLLLVLTSLSACKHEPQSSIPSCLDDTIEAFKTDRTANKIIKITTPDRTLYWFVDYIADGSEPIYDSDCNIFCVTDLNGILNIPCSSDVFKWEQEEIWHK
jgi:hypothetical protein